MDCITLKDPQEGHWHFSSQSSETGESITASAGVRKREPSRRDPGES